MSAEGARVLVTGAGGILGQAVVRTAPAGATVLAHSRAELDITDSRALRELVGDVRPAFIVNTAAYTAVDRAETERDRAFQVNAEALGKLGSIAKEFGAGVVHYSTDYVFDGRTTDTYGEDAAPSPINAYGASKLAGETALAASGAQHLIVRTQWLFGSGGPCFPRTMYRRARAEQPTKVVNDQVGVPTFTVDVARATWDLLGQVGTVHVVNEGTASWYEVAEVIFDTLGKRSLLQPCSTSDYPLPAPRPVRSILSSSTLHQRIGRRMPDWRDALSRYLTEAAVDDEL